MSHRKSLTSNAVLTLVAKIVNQLAGAFVLFFLTPIIVRGLGAELFGIWGIIQRLTGFMGLSNLDAMKALRLKLSVLQHSSDYDEKRRLLGAAALQWFVMLPIVIIGVIILLTVTSNLINVNEIYKCKMQLSLVILCIGINAGQLLSIPNTVLMAQNIEYKGMFSFAFAVIIGGLLNAIGIWAGYGLIMLSVTTLLGMVILNVFRLYIVKKYVDWFSFKLPSGKEALSFIKLSFGASFTSISYLILYSTDVLLIGILYGPKQVAIYVTTSSLCRFSFMPLQQWLRSGNAGISYLVGCKDWNRIAKVRLELHQLALLLMTAMSVVCVCCNRSFVSIWVGAEYYGGKEVNFAIIIFSILRQMVDMDGYILDSLLLLKLKGYIMIICGLFGIIIGLILSIYLKVPGLIFGMILGHIVIFLCFLKVMAVHIKISLADYFYSMARPFVLMSLLFITSFLIYNLKLFNSISWITIIVNMGMLALLSAVAFFVGGVTPEVKRLAYDRIIGTCSIMKRKSIIG